MSMKKNENIVQDDRAISNVREKVPARVASRLEGVVKNLGIKPRRKSRKPRV